MQILRIRLTITPLSICSRVRLLCMITGKCVSIDQSREQGLLYAERGTQSISRMQLTSNSQAFCISPLTRRPALKPASSPQPCRSAPWPSQCRQTSSRSSYQLCRSSQACPEPMSQCCAPSSCQGRVQSKYLDRV